MREDPALAGFFRRRERWKLAELLFFAACVGAYFLPDAHYVLMSQVLIWGMFALSLDLLVGFRNIPSLGHAAFFGTGAYAAGLLGRHGVSDPVVGLLVSALVTGLLGLVMGLVVRRLHGLAVLMVTLSFNLLLEEFVHKARDLTGGDDGLLGIVISPIFGLVRFDYSGRVGYVYALVVAFACIWLVRAVLNTPWGIRLRAGKDNDRRLAMLGANTSADIVWLFGFSALIAGAAGATMTQISQFVSSDAVAFHRSADVLVILIIGGAGSIYGAFVGAAIYIGLRDYFAAIHPVYWYFWVGLLLVLVVAFFRAGIVPTLARLAHRLRLRTARRTEARP